MASLLILAAASSVAAPTLAQDWVVTGAAGRLVHETLGDRVGTLGSTLSLGYDGPLSLYLAGGAPFDTAGIFWGATGARGRILRDFGVSAGLDAAAEVVTFADAAWDTNGWGRSIEIMPVARLERGAGSLELRSGLERYEQSFGGQSSARTLHMSDALLTIASRTLRADGELRYARGDGADHPYAGATAEYAGSTAGAWASVGRWFGEDASGTGWGIGVQLAVAPLGALFASYAQEAWDPLYRNQPRRSWNVGFSRRIGAKPVPAAPEGSPELRNGTASFSVAAAAAPGPISIAGDFTEWETVAMKRAGAEWVVSLPVPSGVHRYAFRDGNGDWFVPPTVADRVDDGFGGFSAVLVVP